MKPRKTTVPEQRRKPRQARARATVAAILEAAARILRIEGRAAFNTNRIAEHAGVSIGTLYLNSTGYAITSRSPEWRQCRGRVQPCPERSMPHAATAR
ncbi:helix-turn-helix domain-containing protein [Devosia sp.]|uniref:TetR/AcrR family transcriptional regulator n=1 Tax=Devosia sp. TaxID=1871048 RepID=UPI001AD46D51|nr:helix-turn-helix domain-containing protein [Devosia sp.]MBN9308763.1 helix-turn-helix transcriptional regulator [Devosia sp.]